MMRYEVTRYRCRVAAPPSYGGPPPGGTTREGFFAVVVVWIAGSFLGAMPF